MKGFSNCSYSLTPHVYFQSVKNYEGLRYYPVHKLANYPTTVFADAGRRHETPGSETKGFIIPGMGRSMCQFPGLVSLAGVTWRYIQVDTMHTVGWHPS